LRNPGPKVRKGRKAAILQLSEVALSRHNSCLLPRAGVGMRRRNFMTVLAGAAAYPLLAGAQQKPMPVIGVLAGTPPEVRGVQRNLAAFREGLGEMGFVEGQNVVIEYRWAERHRDRLPALAAELVARKVDVIVLEGGDSVTLAAKEATSTIPIVFDSMTDPVARGLVASLARPGGNLTGVSLMLGELLPKLLEMLLEVVPAAKLIGVLRDPSWPLDIEHAASTRNVRLHTIPAASNDEVDAAFAALVPFSPGPAGSSPFRSDGRELSEDRAASALARPPPTPERINDCEKFGLVGLSVKLADDIALGMLTDRIRVLRPANGSARERMLDEATFGRIPAHPQRRRSARCVGRTLGSLSRGAAHSRGDQVAS
jgi:putative ABC transport system substrate-binding protein